MRKKLEKIRNILGNATLYKVSPDLDHRVMRALGVLPYLDSENELPEPPHVLTFITQWLMQSSKQFGAVLATLVVLVGGLFFYTQNSYSYHLNKAKIALAELQSVLEGKPSNTAWVPAAMAEESEPVVDEAQVTELSTTVVSETEKAIDIAENKTDPAVVQQALDEISVVQDETVPVLAAAAEAVTSEEATQVVAEALLTTTTDQAMVSQAQDFVATAVASGETQVAIDIQTSSEAPAVQEEEKDEEGRLEQAKSEYKDAKALIEQLKASGADAETLAKLQSKLDKVVSAFEDGKVGRAHGLSTAIAAQGKHLVRKEAKEKREKEEGESKDEDGDDGEDDEQDKKSDEKAARAEENIKAAKELVEQARAAGAEAKDIERVEAKIQKAEEALKEKAGKSAYGLSVAALAECKKLLREAKEADEDKDGDSDESEDSDEGDDDQDSDGDENDEGDDDEDEDSDEGDDDRDSDGNRDESGWSGSRDGERDRD